MKTNEQTKYPIKGKRPCPRCACLRYWSTTKKCTRCGNIRVI